MVNFPGLVSPWYNRNGWLGVKHQVTYLLSCVGKSSHTGGDRPGLDAALWLGQIQRFHHTGNGLHAFIRPWRWSRKGERFHHTGGGLHAFITPGRQSRDGERFHHTGGGLHAFITPGRRREVSSHRGWSACFHHTGEVEQRWGKLDKHK